MAVSHVLMVGLMTLYVLSVQADDAVAPASRNVTDSLFTVLAGSWDGQAIETPIGPVDYAITFHACAEQTIAGVAELRVSDHHWRFWIDRGELRLTFLSTFLGNQQPTQLIVSKIEGSEIWFHAPELTLLTLSVAMVEPHVDIRVFHHHEPHVYIRLTRSDRLMAKAERERNVEKSCKSL